MYSSGSGGEGVGSYTNALSAFRSILGLNIVISNYMF